MNVLLQVTTIVPAVWLGWNAHAWREARKDRKEQERKCQELMKEMDDGLQW